MEKETPEKNGWKCGKCGKETDLSKGFIDIYSHDCIPTPKDWSFRADECIPDEMVVPIKRVELLLAREREEILTLIEETIQEHRYSGAPRALDVLKEKIKNK